MSNKNFLIKNGLSIGADNEVISSARAASFSSASITGATTISGDLTVDSSTLKVDSSNNRVGIGDSSPTTTLHVATGTDGSGLVDVLRLENSGDTVNDGPRIQLTAGQSTSGAGIGALGVSSNSSHLVLHAGGNHERMRIKSDGNVGIGTQAPAKRLHIRDDTQTNQSIRFGNETAAPYGEINYNSSGLEHLYIDSHGTTSGYGYTVLRNGPDLTESIKINSDGYTTIARAGADYGLQIRSSSNRSGLVIDKPGTSTIMGSALVVAADERFKLGTASYYHVEMKQNGDTKINNHLLLTDSFGLRAYSGYFSAGTSTGTFDFNTYGAGCYEVTAAFGHYGYINGYGCFKKAICSNGAGYSSSTSITAIDIATEITTTSGGSWSYSGFSSGSNTTSHIRVTKNAGNYGGGGYYFVEVRGNQSG